MAILFSNSGVMWRYIDVVEDLRGVQVRQKKGQIILSKLRILSYDKNYLDEFWLRRNLSGEVLP